MNRSLATTVALVLAVTAGGLTAPAFAAPPQAAAAAASETTPSLTVPADSELVSAGATGMLTRTGTGTGVVHRWTRHADGVTTTLPAGTRWGSPGTDVVVSRDGAVYTLTDMSGATEPVVIDTSALGTEAAPYVLQRVVGRTLLMKKDVQDGADPFHLVSLEDGQVVDRKVAVPDGNVVRYNYSPRPGALALLHVSSDYATWPLSLVDPATGALTESYTTAPNRQVGGVALTPTHVTWVEDPYSSVNRRQVVADRKTGGRQTVPLPSPGDTTSTTFRALGDWLAYANAGGGTALSPSVLHPLAVRSATTGETFRLLDHVGSVVPDADGSLLALGGTLAQGEGLYRIALDAATGKPAATLVRTSGLPTALTVVKETLPPTGTFDFDLAGGRLTAGWTLSRFNAHASLTLKHTASGRTVQLTALAPGTGVTDFPLDWNGLYDDGMPAYNGAYTWTMRAEPANGIGPAVERTGTFTLTRAPRPHDVDGNGSPDVLGRDGTGYLSSNDLRQLWSLHPGEGQPVPQYDPYSLPIGPGWQVYDRIAATGDIAGTGNGDLVARDGTGMLWFYAGKGTHTAPFAARTQIGGGWQVYDKLTGGSDLTGDGRADLLATDKAGVLWLYASTGDAKAPFQPKKQIGGGWQVYTEIVATGDLAGATGGDLVARDTAGALWLYLGKGDGTFTARTLIGSGWQAYEQILGVGDVDGDGRNDLVAKSAAPNPEPDTSRSGLALYRGTGDRTVPLAARQFIASVGTGDQLS
ncbi:VCBS repeat-containing protein [Streptomyces sp. NPDC007863]|uniref:FG-GAP repeat domain-containing protein n=1 Tax=Streptomyces sp. NPDC007863 TaxID=3154894 RepID=UPI0034027CF4